MNQKTENIIVGFRGCMITGIGFKFIYKHDKKHSPIKRKLGNPNPRLHSLVFGKSKK
jgi:hypothetical protein